MALSETRQQRRPLLPQEFIDNYKRWRVLVAIAGLAHEGGAGELTTTQIIARAKISRPTFYELFESKAACFAFACGAARRYLVGPIEAAGEAPGPWPERMSAAVGDLLAAAAEQPLLAELCLLHAAGMRREPQEPCGEAVVEALARLAADGRGAGRQAAGGLPYREPQPGTEELVACAIVSVVAPRVRAGAAELPELREELTGMALRPFLGATPSMYAWQSRRRRSFISR